MGLDEFQRISTREDAYRFLYEKGEWNRVLLYHARQFTEECPSLRGLPQCPKRLFWTLRGHEPSSFHQISMRCRS